MMSIQGITRLNHSGVTLVETLLVMGLMSGLLIVLATIFTASIDVQQSSSAYSATTISGRYIVAKLNYDISHSTAILSPNAPGATNNVLVLAANNTSYLYRMNNNTMQFVADARPYSLSSDDVIVSGISFKYYGDGIKSPMIQYTFTLSSVVKSHGTSDSQTFTGSAGLQQ